MHRPLGLKHYMGKRTGHMNQASWMRTIPEEKSVSTRPSISGDMSSFIWHTLQKYIKIGHFYMSKLMWWIFLGKFGLKRLGNVLSQTGH